MERPSSLVNISMTILKHSLSDAACKARPDTFAFPVIHRAFNFPPIGLYIERLSYFFETREFDNKYAIHLAVVKETDGGALEFDIRAGWRSALVTEYDIVLAISEYIAERYVSTTPEKENAFENAFMAMRIHALRSGDDRAIKTIEDLNREIRDQK